jgi:uncharacterized protein (DUF4213/DUF364 family)
VSLAADLVATASAVTSARSGLEARRVEVGPRFFGVAPAERGSDALLSAGVAFLGAHQRPDAGRIGAALEGARGTAVEELARGLDLGGENLVRTAIGAAAVNALLLLRLTDDGTALGAENGLDVLARHATGKRLAVVGRFPYLEEIRAQASRSWILELEPEGEESPPSDAPEILGQAEVVGITGSAVANGTLEGLLRACRREAFVVLIGPSTPLSPVLFEYGASVLCGVVAEDPALTLASIGNEGSTRRIPGTRAVSLVRP